MLNLIRMDLYRLIHSKSTWVIMVFVIALAIFGSVMTDTDIELLKEEPAIATEASEDRPIGIYVEAQPEWLTGSIEMGSEVSAEMRSELLAVLCVIFAAIFANGDYKNGYIKNIAGRFPRREQLVISKFVTIAFQVFLMTALFVATLVISGYVLWGSDFYLGDAGDFFKYIFVQYLLHLGMASLIMFLCLLTRSAAFGMTGGILFCSGLAVPLYALINKGINGLKHGLDFDINKYVLDGNITMLKYDSAASMIDRGLLVGAAFAVVSLALAVLITKKRDIR